MTISDTVSEGVELTLGEARERLRASWMKIQRNKRGGPSDGEGALPAIWDAINAIPAALYHLDRMPEFEADLAAEEADAARAALGTAMQGEGVEAAVQAVREALDEDKLYSEARQRMMRDMTGEGYDHHLVSVVIEHAVKAALRASQGGETK